MRSVIGKIGIIIIPMTIIVIMLIKRNYLKSLIQMKINGKRKDRIVSVSIIPNEQLSKVRITELSKKTSQRIMVRFRDFRWSIIVVMLVTIYALTWSYEIEPTLYYTTLHYTSLHYTTLYRSAPHGNALYYTILYYTILYYTILYYAIPHHAMLY